MPQQKSHRLQQVERLTAISDGTYKLWRADWLNAVPR